MSAFHQSIIAKLHPWSTDTTRKTFSKRIFLKRKKKKEEQRQLGSWLSPWLDGDPSTNRAAHKSFPPFIKRSGIRNENIKRVRHAVSRSVVPPPPRSKNNLKVHAREYPSGGGRGTSCWAVAWRPHTARILAYSLARLHSRCPLQRGLGQSAD